MARDEKIDPGTGDFSEIRALPLLMNAVYLSCFACTNEQRKGAWEGAINVLMRTVPL